MDTPEITPETLPPVPSTGGFGPLRVALFRDRWIASTISSVGTWMQDTAGTWLMTSLTSSPLLIALMQTAASLPVLFLGLLAGATADVFDRRKLLIFWQVWMLVSVAVLAILTFFGYISPWTLLALTFLLNIGSAMNNPAWQAIVPELIPRELIADAVSLNSASNNLARAVGPALGGLMVATFKKTGPGAGSVFFLNAISFAGVIWVLVNWKRVPLFKSTLPAERIAGSMRSGLRYIRYAPELQASLLRAFVFTFFVSAVWSLLALVAQRDLHQGAMGYGILNGSMGLGALLAASVLHRLRSRFSADTIIAASTVVYIVTLVILAFIKMPAIIIVTLIVAGFAWTSTMATLNTSVQLSVPAWVQARVLGTYLMTFQGGLAIGSIIWGAVAERTSTSTALLSAAAGLLISFPIAQRFHVMRGKTPDFTPYQWKRPAPQYVLDSEPSAGPVRISILYRVPVEHYPDFTRAIHAMRGVRLRDGAMRWGIFRDANDPESLNETFVTESWLDYLRSRERMTAADAEIRQSVLALTRSDTPPVTTHQIYAKEITDPSSSS
ncbi:MFS transporter [Granulicella arctica]|uniref:MFS family permease n=1 Tax=Granulicella arctica TaxID=940613 RepID=A0A7Y9TEJ2_9BACT|nr:MFS transporter [Granulicella arctica]NYF77741.1 MFS family permease [Granulicella arctica]